MLAEGADNTRCGVAGFVDNVDAFVSPPLVCATAIMFRPTTANPKNVRLILFWCISI